jgi:hypothetical protein
MNELVEAGEHGSVRGGMRRKFGIPLQRRSADELALEVLRRQQPFGLLSGCP